LILRSNDHKWVAMTAARISRPEDVGAIILEYRREHRLTQSQLAAKLGVSPRWLSHVENGKPTLQLGLVSVVRRFATSWRFRIGRFSGSCGLRFKRPAAGAASVDWRW